MWPDELPRDCPSWLLPIIQNGFRLPFCSPPPTRPLLIPKNDTYAFSPGDKIQVDQVIQDMLRKGAIEHVPMTDRATPGFTSSLFVVPKKDGGRRPVLNLKALNQYLPRRPFKMETLATISKMLAPGDYLTSVDLSDAFFHVGIASSDRRYLRFLWDQRAYQYRVLPFGLSLSPWIFTKTVRPLLKWARRKGIRITAYLDDFLVMASSKERCIHQTHLVLQKMAALGWQVNIGKSLLTPSQQIDHLGMRIDSVNMSFSVPGKKVRAIRRSAYFLLHQDSVPWQRLSSFVGTALATQLGCQQARLRTRFLLQQLNHWRPHQVSRYCPISPRMKGELAWWLSQLQRWNGRHVVPPPPQRMVFTDASDHGWGLVDGARSFQGQWPKGILQRHINFKELMVVRKALDLLDLPPGAHVQVALDNASAKAYLDKHGGTRSHALNQLAVEIWTHCFHRRIILSTVFVPSKFNPADAPSRAMMREAEWTLPRTTFEWIDRHLGPHHVDLFASASTALLPRYVSRTPDPQALWVNAFARPWTHLAYLRLLIVPPWNLLPQVIARLQHQPQPATLITPTWPSAHWWPTLLQLSTKEPLQLPINDDDGHPLYKHTTMAAWSIAHPDADASL